MGLFLSDPLDNIQFLMKLNLQYHIVRLEGIELIANQKKCKRRIHASRLHDKKTWMVCHFKSYFLLFLSVLSHFYLVLAFGFHVV